jgi:hypothetical protein
MLGHVVGLVATLACTREASCPKPSNAAPVSSTPPAQSTAYTAAAAEPDATDTPRAAAVPEAEWKRVMATLTLDLDGDGAADRVVLVEPSDSDPSIAELLVWVSSSTNASKPLHDRSLAVSLGTWGGLPELRADRAGEFTVVAQNDAIGRDRWRQMVTLSIQREALAVLRYEFSQRDTLAPNSESRCVLDFAAGTGVLAGKGIAIPHGQVPLNALKAHLPDGCGTVLE